ncbi:carbon monoxide dehydrogenase [Rhodobacteraceae bacterium RKSG542]|uniref:SRPBCC family protein n=1 Tax=Pseudovibrio flavus TaxID=2529854 RepID=UPI0012BD5E2A|nr:carbon monoxide dehydrogenase subunit G [Pseudovibrio flavus]MTI17227.1 carbon monoxide dehydrogenase [Pseudovibrio flavus]
MEMTGEQLIPASREAVWEALNDPEVLKKCIPGCEELNKTSATEMNALVTAKVGPVKAKFKGEVTLSDLDPPKSYKISGEGKGGVAGFAKGGAEVTLAEEGGQTRLSYSVNAKVGGKLAQLGARLIDSTAKKMADDFFSALNAYFGGDSGEKDENLTRMELDEGLAEEAKTIANENAAAGLREAAVDAEQAVEETVKDVEEKIEVAAGKGTMGGPMVWGFGALLLLIILYLIF